MVLAPWSVLVWVRLLEFVLHPVGKYHHLLVWVSLAGSASGKTAISSAAFSQYIFKQCSYQSGLYNN